MDCETAGKRGDEEKSSEIIEVPIGYFKLRKGRGYLIENSRGSGFLPFVEALKFDLSGLCISTRHPKKVSEDYGMSNCEKMIWLSTTRAGKAVNPSELNDLKEKIITFISREKNSIILLDGLEQILFRTSFEKVFKFLYDVLCEISTADSIIIVPISPNSIGRENLAMLENCMGVLKYSLEGNDAWI